MPNWKITKAPNSRNCRACNKDISNKKAYIKKTTSMGSFFKNLLTDNYYCTQSCFNSHES